MKLKIAMLAAAALLAGTAVAGAQSDNPPGTKFQTEQNRAAQGVPEKPSGIHRRHVAVRHHSSTVHRSTVGLGASGSDNPPGSKFQSERNRTSAGKPPQPQPGTQQ